MQNSAKWTIGMLSALILAAPLSLWLWMWRDSHWGHVKQRHEAAEVIARFHEHFNSSSEVALLIFTGFAGGFFLLALRFEERERSKEKQRRPRRSGDRHAIDDPTMLRVLT